MACCGWLTAVGRKAKALAEDETICRPTEIQWERAARGTERRRWPWGDTWQDGAANTQQPDPWGTTAVGLFPAESP